MEGRAEATGADTPRLEDWWPEEEEILYMFRVNYDDPTKANSVSDYIERRVTEHKIV